MKKLNLKIKELKQTCEACPSQWEGKFEDGSDLYIRFRWGFLRVDQDGQTIFGKQISDSLDGVIEEEKMLRITGLELIK